MYNCKMSLEQNERNQKIQAVAERALHKMSYDDIASELNISIEEVCSRMQQLKELNPQAYMTIENLRAGTL